jgi:hypothetical protein
MLELSEAKGKKERSLLPVSFAFAKIIKNCQINEIGVILVTSYQQ